MKDYTNILEEEFHKLYKKNLDYFKEFHHQLYFKLKNFPGIKKYALELKEYIYQNKTIQIPNIKILDSQTFAYQNNPLIDAKSSAENSLINDPWLKFKAHGNPNATNIDKAVFISNGLGFHLKEYNKRFQIKSLLIVEEDMELFLLSMFVTDYKELSFNKQIEFCIQENLFCLKNHLLRFYYALFFYNNSIKIIETFQSDIVKDAADIFKSCIDTKIFSRNLDFQEILLDKKYIIDKKEFYPYFEDIKSTVKLNQTFEAEKIFTVMQLLNTLLLLNISKKEYLKLSNKLYYYIYLISTQMDNRFMQFKYSAYSYLECMDAISLLSKDIYKEMITTSYGVKDYKISIRFCERFIEFLKQKDTKEDKDLLSYTRYQLNALKGESLEKASKDYVKFEFDNFANSFENILINSLNYKAPQLIVENISFYIDLNKEYYALDLGCGTGLLGDSLKSISKKIDGVDLSKEMLNVAKRKNIYTNLIECDIEEYLEREKEDKYDLITAGDVFIYIGDLNKVFKYVKKVIMKNGIFAFSIELCEDEDYKLNRSGRFSQSKEYIEALCKKFDFTILNTKQIQLRLESNEYLKGEIFILKS